MMMVVVVVVMMMMLMMTTTMKAAYIITITKIVMMTVIMILLAVIVIMIRITSPYYSNSISIKCHERKPWYRGSPRGPMDRWPISSSRQCACRGFCALTVVPPHLANIPLTRALLYERRCYIRPRGPPGSNAYSEVQRASVSAPVARWWRDLWPG